VCEFAFQLEVRCLLPCVCDLLARLVIGKASLFELVLCGFVFELLCRKQWIQMSRDEVGLFVYKCVGVGFAFQVRTGTCHSTESALSLVVDQSQCTFFSLIGVSPIECVFSNLASLYKLISR